MSISRLVHAVVSLACSLYNKEQEFRAWLVEERKINPETTSKEQTKKEFARFVEDYNTGPSQCFLAVPLHANTDPHRHPATLPHEKFYHMEEYERRMAALRAGEYLPPASDSYDPTADMRAHQSTHKRRAVERDTYMSKEQLMELRRVQNERIEVRRLFHMFMTTGMLTCMSTGWEDEASGDGHKAEHGCAHGRYDV